MLHWNSLEGRERKKGGGKLEGGGWKRKTTQIVAQFIL